ncbi:hypothetical protein ACLOJK_004917 [Asimina triloba]
MTVKLEAKLKQELKEKKVSVPESRISRPKLNQVRDMVLAEYLSNTNYKARENSNHLFYVHERFQKALRGDQVSNASTGIIASEL